MFLNSNRAEPVIDWLEGDAIRRALIAARPSLEDTMVLTEDRPLIRIPHRDGSILIAKIAEGTVAQWVVGIPGRPEPRLHEPGTPEEIVQIALDELDGGMGRTHCPPCPAGR